MKTSSGYLLPAGWLPINELTAEMLEQTSFERIAMIDVYGSHTMLDDWIGRERRHIKTTLPSIILEYLREDFWVGYQIIESLKRIK